MLIFLIENDMRRLKIFLIILMDIAFSSGNVTGANYRAVYDFEYTKDSINSIIEKTFYIWKYLK